MTDIVMPQLGETVAEGTVTRWFKAVGDAVARGDTLFEVASDKVDTEIPAPASGTLAAIYVAAGMTVDVGTVLAVIVGAHEVVVPPASPDSATTLDAAPAPPPAPATPAAPGGADERLSPVVRRLLAESGLRAEEVVGTGPRGRITRDDVVAAARGHHPAAAASLSPVVRRLLAEAGLRADQVRGTGPGGRITRRDVEAARTSAPPGGDEVIAFSRLRARTAEHMTRSKATSAHTLMARQIDYEPVERVRRQVGDAFRAAYGFSLTYLPFNAAATLAALREFPQLNASVGDQALVVHHDLHLGIAVDLEDTGLVVPVVHHADRLSLVDLARRIRQLAEAARSKRLTVDDAAGGTFTITNPGPFGTLMTGAIINQPQVAILSTDGVRRAPVVVDTPAGEALAIHSVGLAALTFDHRVIDGAYAARFLRRLEEILATRDWRAELGDLPASGPTR